MTLNLNVEGLAREVLAKRVAVVGVVTAVLHLAIAMHWLTVAQSDADIAKVTGALDALGTIVGVLYARRAVTPVADPRDAHGNPATIVPVAATSATSVPQWSDDEIAAAADEWVPEHAVAAREWVPEHAAQPASV
jgi:hypothetical protein